MFVFLERMFLLFIIVFHWFWAPFEPKEPKEPGAGGFSTQYRISRILTCYKAIFYRQQWQWQQLLMGALLFSQPQ